MRPVPGGFVFFIIGYFIEVGGKCVTISFNWCNTNAMSEIFCMFFPLFFFFFVF